MSAEAQTADIGRGDKVAFWDYKCTVIEKEIGPDGQPVFRVGTMNKMVTAIFEDVKLTQITLIEKARPKVPRGQSVPIAIH